MYEESLLGYVARTLCIGLIGVSLYFMFVGLPANAVRTSHEKFLSEEVYGTSNLVFERYSVGDDEATYLVDFKGNTDMVTVWESNEGFDYEVLTYEGMSAKEFQSKRRSDRRRSTPIIIPIFH